MKFLVIRKPRVNAGMLPSSKTFREAKQSAQEAIKQGVIDCIYAIPAGGGNVAIVNADSPEELNQRIMDTPLFLFSEWELRPLTDYAKYMDNIAAVFERQSR
jgi:muconolactone delta-isomerase